MKASPPASDLIIEDSCLFDALPAEVVTTRFRIWTRTTMLKPTNSSRVPKLENPEALTSRVGQPFLRQQTYPNFWGIQNLGFTLTAPNWNALVFRSGIPYSAAGTGLQSKRGLRGAPALSQPPQPFRAPLY